MTSLHPDFSWFSRPIGAPAAPAFSREGRRWRLRFGHRTTFVDHSVGMLHLAVLTANPGRQISALDLVAGLASLTGPGTVAKASVPALGQPVLDGAAVREYRSRLTRLRAELDAASARGDAHAVTRMQAERTWILSELAGATGLGGRTRGFPDEAERARIAAGKAIRRAIDRIAVADRLIGEHLRATIHTGVRCSYQPHG
ncbi:MAG TPA: hypothetical protein VFU73_02505 [Actinocrinis sp.]|nr:hypothetical protein [Actinocrinis sp.]